MDVNWFGSIRIRMKGQGFVVLHGGNICKENTTRIACGCRWGGRRIRSFENCGVGVEHVDTTSFG